MIGTAVTVKMPPALEDQVILTLRAVSILLYVLAGATIFWCVFGLFHW